jgi:hypothetical protein
MEVKSSLKVEIKLRTSRECLGALNVLTNGIIILKKPVTRALSLLLSEIENTFRELEFLPVTMAHSRLSLKMRVFPLPEERESGEK